eukprot:TRINITY_DN48683_c0_g1_i1.p1 TRINITY_DN48683_c0_g1~~TRINITY_DN48683_c0_g1_i1.p1  ORF type:complete len:237 (+),score=22.95 TRINITY_DN48683_c0_g1_i1:101-712(+)
MSREVPKAFHPVAWDQIKCEAIRKERSLRSTSSSVYRDLVEAHGTSNTTHTTPSGWAYFTGAGFCDANDMERLQRKVLPQRPYWHPDRPAGHDNMETQMQRTYARFEAQGRGAFLDRTRAADLERLSCSLRGRLHGLPGSSGAVSAPVSPANSTGGMSRTLSRSWPNTPFGPGEPMYSGVVPRRVIGKNLSNSSASLSATMRT